VVKVGRRADILAEWENPMEEKARANERTQIGQFPISRRARRATRELYEINRPARSFAGT
jgi:hypothetical protein